MVLGSRESIINAVYRIASRQPNKKRFTMAEIAREAGMSRQAIYQKHYRGVNEIFDDIHRSISEKTFLEMEVAIAQNPSLSIYDIISEVIIPMVYRERLYERILYHTGMKFNWSLFIQEKYQKLLESKTITVINNGPFSQESMVKIMLSYLSAIIAEWIAEDFPDPPEIFVQKFKTMIETSPQDLIDSQKSD